jgi:hypothetical protein
MSINSLFEIIWRQFGLIIYGKVVLTEMLMNFPQKHPQGTRIYWLYAHHQAVIFGNKDRDRHLVMEHEWNLPGIICLAALSLD